MIRKKETLLETHNCYTTVKIERDNLIFSIIYCNIQLIPIYLKPKFPNDFYICICLNSEDRIIFAIISFRSRYPRNDN